MSDFPKVYSTVCPFCNSDSSLKVVEITFVETNRTVETNVPLLAEGFAAYQYSDNSQKDFSTRGERVRCSSCGYKSSLVRFLRLDTFLEVDEQYRKEYENGRREFKVDYHAEEQLDEYPSLMNYADALVMGRLAASQIYVAETYSHERMDQALWFLVGWMQSWTEIVER